MWVEVFLGKKRLQSYFKYLICLVSQCKQCPFWNKWVKNLEKFQWVPHHSFTFFSCHKSKGLIRSLVTIFKPAHLWLILEGYELKPHSKNKTSRDKLTITMHVKQMQMFQHKQYVRIPRPTSDIWDSYRTCLVLGCALSAIYTEEVLKADLDLQHSIFFLVERAPMFQDTY